MKKKIAFIDSSELPTGEHVTRHPSDERPLLLVVDNNPAVQLGIYRDYNLKSANGGAPFKMKGFHIIGVSYDPEQPKVLAWRPVPKMPTEYYEKTKYNFLLQRRAKIEKELKKGK